MGPPPTGGGDGAGRLAYSFEDPFATPEADRREDRRLRGRLVAPVCVVTSFGEQSEPAGLTVSSVLVADGEPAELLALVDPLGALVAACRESGRAVVHLLRAGDERVAELFAGRYPADPFEEVAWHPGEYGPVLEGGRPTADCAVTEIGEAGYHSLLRARIETVGLGGGAEPLAWYRGGYRLLAPPG